jgi:hypothetical protein
MLWRLKLSNQAYDSSHALLNSLAIQINHYTFHSYLGSKYAGYRQISLKNKLYFYLFTIFKGIL